jgi:hypothetical protein
LGINPCEVLWIGVENVGTKPSGSSVDKRRLCVSERGDPVPEICTGVIHRLWAKVWKTPKRYSFGYRPVGNSPCCGRLRGVIREFSPGTAHLGGAPAVDDRDFLSHPGAKLAPPYRVGAVRGRRGGVAISILRTWRAGERAVDLD